MVSFIALLTIAAPTDMHKVMSIDTTSVFAGKYGHQVYRTLTIDMDGKATKVTLNPYHDAFYPLPKQAKPGDEVKIRNGEIIAVR
jgi:hypothetical protein